MKYPSKLYREADSILADRRLQAEIEFDQRKEIIRCGYPQIQQIRKDLYNANILYGKCCIINPAEAPALREQIINLWQCLHEQLAAHDFPSDYLNLQPTCPICNDKGIVDGHSCRCRIEILNRLTYEMLSETSQVSQCCFDGFDLSFYPQDIRPQMEKLFISCKRYVEGFCSRSPNLLFMGQTGLGKTHLSLAIARGVATKGRMVLYASAAQLISRLVEISFNPESPDEYKAIVYGCDLLILDDLGTEFQTKFTKSEVYSLINTRCIEGRPTIINTNLTLQDIEGIYDQRVASRLAGEYVVNQFLARAAVCKNPLTPQGAPQPQQLQLTLSCRRSQKHDQP